MILSPRRHRTLLVAHIASAVAILGADLALLTLGVAGARGADPRTVYPAARLVGEWVMAPLAVPTVVVGVLLAVGAGYGLGGNRWLVLKIGVTTLLLVALLAVVIPALRDAAAAALAGEALAPAQRVRLTAGSAASSALLLLNVTLGVTKPALRRARPPRAAAMSTGPVAGASRSSGPGPRTKRDGAAAGEGAG